MPRILTNNEQRLSALIDNTLFGLSCRTGGCLTDRCIQSLECCYYLTKHLKRGNYFAINSILWSLTHNEPLTPTDYQQAAKVLAMVKNFADKYEINIDKDSIRPCSLLNSTTYAKIRELKII
jgi:hypothetical protein